MQVSEEPNISPPNYRWPFYVAGLVAIWIIVTVIWMFWGVDEARQEREQGMNLDSVGNQLHQTNRLDDYE